MPSSVNGGKAARLRTPNLLSIRHGAGSQFLRVGGPPTGGDDPRAIFPLPPDFAPRNSISPRVFSCAAREERDVVRLSGPVDESPPPDDSTHVALDRTRRRNSLPAPRTPATASRRPLRPPPFFRPVLARGTTS